MAIQFVTSGFVQRQVGWSGAQIRKMVRRGYVTPSKDSTGRFLYSEQDVETLQRLKAERDEHRRKCKTDTPDGEDNS